MLSRLGAALALSTGLLLATAAPAAHAEDPVDLDGAYVLDTVGAISGSEDRVRDALDSLYQRADIQLFVVYVDGFSNPSDPVDWADTTAIDNGLGTNDVLLAVAIEDRQFALSIDSAFTLSDPQLDVVEAAIERELSQDDWAAAAIVGAQTLEAEATGVVGPNRPTAQPEDPVDAAGGIPWLPIVGGAAVVGVGVFVYSRVRKRNGEGEVTAAPERMSQQELDRRSGSLLVQLDDSVKTSEQELGFAVAQFGEAATREFTAALHGAKQKVQRAFELKQRLDDATPESTEEQRALTTEIIQLCEAADAELDAQADAFDELRALEQYAPQAIAATQQLAEAATARRAAAATALDGLAARYAESAIAPVAANLQQADKLLEFAADATAKARESVSATRASDAAIQVRSAQASIGQANQLFDAIDTLGAELGTASADLETVVTDTTRDIAAAKALPADPALAPAIAAASTALDAARDAARDPATALAQLQAANASLEQVFTDVRSEQERVAHARSRLDATVSTARAQVAAATDYITTRRGGIGSSARTRVSEAERHLAQALALSTSDPVQALAEAQQANDLASSAMSLARNDVERFERSQSLDSTGGGYYAGSDGADLGGILGDWLLGGGGSSGSSRSSGWNWGGGGSSSRSSRSSSSRSSRSGSFGGSSRSSRSSGGRRSRGGRF